MKATLRFAGGAEHARFLRELPARTSKSVQMRALRAGAVPIENAMVLLAPHDPGEPDLRDTITVSSANDDDQVLPGEVAVAIGPSLKGFYGSFQEFGTARHGAQPFARPAFDQNWERSMNLIRQFLWTEMVKRLPTTGIHSGARTL